MNKKLEKLNFGDSLKRMSRRLLRDQLKEEILSATEGHDMLSIAYHKGIADDFDSCLKCILSAHEDNPRMIEEMFSSQLIVKIKSYTNEEMC